MPKRKTIKKKPKKDKNKPKRSMSSFMFFANEKRQELKNIDPNMKVTEISKKLGELWKKLSNEEKKKYEDLAVKDKERYDSEMSHYIPPETNTSSEDEIPKKRKNKKIKKDPNKPKRSMSSFMFFAKEKRQSIKEQYPDIKITEIGKKLSELWKKLTPEEKKKYEEEANKDKVRYSTEMANYTPSSSNVTKEKEKEVFPNNEEEESEEESEEENEEENEENQE